MAQPANLIVLPDHNYGATVALPREITTVLPTARDVVDANRFRREVTVQREHLRSCLRITFLTVTTDTEGGPDVEAVAAAIQYEVKVSGAGAEPPWLGPLIARLEAKLDNVERLVIAADIRGIRNNNATLNGANGLEEVPFPDGTRPWGKQVAGPHANQQVILRNLDTVQAVWDLTPPQTHGYYRGYYPDRAPPLPPVLERKSAILTAIGRRPDGLLI